MKSKTSKLLLILGIIGLVLVTLKLEDVIYWSWWVVSTPLYVHVLFSGTVLFIYVKSNVLKSK